jgi:hypothetical protein
MGGREEIPGAEFFKGKSIVSLENWKVLGVFE